MQTDICKRLGIEFPIFAFSHCRDVVAAVSKAGGLGVFGASRLTADELAVELEALESELSGRPYGVDVVVSSEAPDPPEQLRRQLPASHVDFVRELAERFGIPPADYELSGETRGKRPVALNQWEVTARFDPAMLVGALGPLPAEIAAEAKERGIMIGGLVGKVRHAEKQIEAGADVIVAQGTEAGGHTGDITTMVLLPQVVDAVAPVPVLAAGGIGDGRQVAAALAMGAQGVWLGSIWLTTAESDLPDVLVEKLLAADSTETVRTPALTGRPVRVLKTDWVEAWSETDAPGFLSPSLQRMLVNDQLLSMEQHSVRQPITSAVGQIVGTMRQRRSTAQVISTLVEEYLEAVEALSALTEGSI